MERNLSQALGISRTPLREALLGLEAEGLLRAEPERGFFVAALSVEEAREIYPLIGALEALAIERGRPTVLDGADDQRFRAAKDQAQAVERDREWHETLIGRCGTPRMAAILQGLRTAAGRYEYRFFSGRHVIAESARQHGEIAGAPAGAPCPRGPAPEAELGRGTEMDRKRLSALALGAAPWPRVLTAAPSPARCPKDHGQWTNGRWFDGAAFRRVTCTPSARLTLKRPAPSTRRWTSAGATSPAPLARRTTTTSPGSTRRRTSAPISTQGIFYVMIQANTPEAPAELRPLVDTPGPRST